MSINQAVIRGALSSVPDIRVLASGTSLATLQLTTRPSEGPAVSVPVSVTDPQGWVATLQPGDEVVVIGTVRRRFFRAGGATASRVEVDASVVVKSTDKRALRRVARIAQAVVDEIMVPAA